MTSKVIRGKKYDTSKSEEIANWSNVLGARDFHHCEETLYRTKNGSYFLVGSGGPMSKYSRAIGQNQWSGDSDVFRVLDREQALLWCEQKGVSTAVIEREFADMLEDG